MSPTSLPPDLDRVSRTGTVPFASDLTRHGDRAAFVTADGEISYRDLASRVATMAQRLGPHGG